MYIVFNAVVSGLGNNGGSRTVLLSSQVLESFGHKVDVIASTDNFTWFDHKSVINYIPGNADVIINVAAVDYTVTRGSKVPKKYAWWRAHEDWSNAEEFLIKCYLDKEVKNIVNSVGLQKLLEKYGAKSEVVYQGIDFDLWKNKGLRPNDKIRLGALYTKQPRKRWKDFVSLYNILGTDDYEYVSVGSAVPGDTFLTKSVCNVGSEELEKIYSSCHIWVSMSESEGLHNVPMEAALSGALIMCNNHPLNGMTYDYVEDKKTCLVYITGDMVDASRCVDTFVSFIRNNNASLFIENMEKKLKHSICDRGTNMVRMISIINGAKGVL